MSLSSLLVCADDSAVQVLSRVLVNLEISVEPCGKPGTALQRLATEQFDALILDCVDEAAAVKLAVEARRTPDNHNTLIIALVNSQNNVRELFEQGINFVLYKPVSEERASASLQAARNLMRRERRRYPRIPVHAAATMEYAGSESVPATILDLSEDGIAIQCQRRLPPRCKVYFQFRLPGHPSTVRFSGLSMWQDSSGRVGIRFVDVPQFSRKALGDWLSNNAIAFKKAESDVARVHSVPKAVVVQDSEKKAPSSGSERRGGERRACRLSADVFVLGTNAPQHCHVSDISTGGCYVDTTTPLPLKTEVAVVIRTDSMKVRAEGIVRETHPACGMGILFVLHTAAERAQVQKLVDSLAEESIVR